MRTLWLHFASVSVPTVHRGVHCKAVPEHHCARSKKLRVKAQEGNSRGQPLWRETPKKGGVEKSRGNSRRKPDLDQSALE